MSKNFPVHSAETAPIEAHGAFEAAFNAFGLVPNLIGVMSSSPALADAYLALSDIFENKTTLSSVEKQVVLLAVSRCHGCQYCVAAHSMSAEFQQVPDDVINAIRNDTPISDHRLKALYNMTTAIVQNRGWLSDSEVENFFSAGYTAHQLLDVLVGVAQKTLSNFTNHIADTPLDQQMANYQWDAASKNDNAQVR